MSSNFCDFSLAYFIIPPFGLDRSNRSIAEHFIPGVLKASASTNLDVSEFYSWGKKAGECTPNIDDVMRA